jgi:hypothetical protein
MAGEADGAAFETASQPAAANSAEFAVIARLGSMPVLVGHQNYGCLLRSHSRKWVLRHLIRQQLQNRLSPYIIFLIRRGQQPAKMVKILPMNELLHNDLPEGALAQCRRAPFP